MGIRKNLFDISGEIGATSLKVENREVAHAFSGMDGRDAKPHMYIGDRHIYMISIEKIAGILIHVLQRGDLSRLRRRPLWTLAISPESLDVC